MFRAFKKKFWQPPRAHGEVVEDRSVSFLELFYDLVYVVVIARAAHALADHPSWDSAGEFAVVFAMIWIAWLNGSVYYETHGREDGRTRTFVFAQMILLTVLAVYTGDAANGSGRPFAITFTAYLAVATWLWWALRRVDGPEWRRTARPYLVAMVLSTAAVGASVFASDETRIWWWTSFVIVYILIASAQSIARRGSQQIGITVTDSLVERFGLFTIIVLGEVVVGVVDGIAAADGGWRALTTGILALTIGFALWWTYFDFVGRRLPRPGSLPLLAWMLGHLPVTLAIGASGAAMVSLIEHADDAHTPTVISWLLAGSVSLGLLSLVAVIDALADFRKSPDHYRIIIGTIVVAAVVVLAIGWWAPAPLVLAGSISVVLAVAWLVAVLRLFALVEARPATKSATDS